MRPRSRRSFEPPRRPEPQTRINDAIRVPRVRLIDENGEQLGIKSTDEARDYAYSKNLDLVEVAAQADPPVCRVMDYGKYRYELEQKAKLARKHQTQINVKEIKLRPKIGTHDYQTKRGHVERFLNQRAKVKVTIMFRGREREHPDRGRDLLMRLADDVISSVPRHIAKRYRVVPTYRHGNSITIALDEPSDLDTIDSLHHLLKAEVTISVATSAFCFLVIFWPTSTW